MSSIIRLLTLVDITATGVTRNIEGRELERNQQRNFETVLQVLGLRTQPSIIRYPEVHEVSADDPIIWFGDFYNGRPQRLWSFLFTSDYIGSYHTESGELEGLKQDFAEVPVITGLTETAKFMLPIFYPYGTIKNIHTSFISDAK
jgi:hypothetical protein